MRQYASGAGWELLHGDCIEAMRGMSEASVDAIVCDPPAGIGFMGRGWDGNRGGRDQWIDWLAEVMSEGIRVLKPGAHALVWALPRTSHWTGMALEDAGFDVRDRITHLFGSGFPKSANISKHIDRAAGAEREVVGRDSRPAYDSAYANWDKPYEKRSKNFGQGEWDLTAPATPEAAAWDGWGTALKPGGEDWWLCRKPLAEGTVASNVLAWGTGGINVDACRIGTEQRTYGMSGAPGGNGVRLHGGDGRDAENARRYACESKSKPPVTVAGRWPSNVCLSHSPECEQVGTRRVRGAPHLGQKNPELTKQYSGGTFGGGRVTPGSGFSDAEGCEEVETWNCAPPHVEHHACITLDGVTLNLATASPVALQSFGDLLTSALQDNTRNEGKSEDPHEVLDAEWASAVPDFPGGCPTCRDFDDALFRDAQAASRVSALQLADVLGRALGHIRSLPYTLPSQPPGLPTSEDVAPCYTSDPGRDPNRTSGGDHGPTSSLEPAVRMSGKDEVAPPRSAPHDSSRVSSTSAPSCPGQTIACRNEHIGALSLALVSIAGRFSASYLPLSFTVQQLYHTGCAVRLLDEQAGVRTSGAYSPPSARPRHGHKLNACAGASNAPDNYGDTGGASRFFYTAKSSRSERGKGCTHPTVKPLALMRWLCRLITPPGGLILDPFAGSGSTGVAAIAEGFRFIGIEREAEYCEMARERLAGVHPRLPGLDLP